MESDIAVRLRAKGVEYRSRQRFGVGAYIFVKVAIAVLAFSIGRMAGIVFGLIFCIISLPLEDYIIDRINRRDNEKMLESIREVYDVLWLQINGGGHINRIIADAYRVVSNPRLKQGFIELAGDIISTGDYKEALDRFDGKFDNDNLKAFVILIKQITESGNSDKMIRDIKRHMDALQKNYNDVKRDQVARRGQACAMCIFISLVGIMAVVCMDGFLNSLNQMGLWKG